MIDSVKIDAFARLMTEKLDNGDTNARKGYIHARLSKARCAASPAMSACSKGKLYSGFSSCDLLTSPAIFPTLFIDAGDGAAMFLIKLPAVGSALSDRNTSRRYGSIRPLLPLILATTLLPFPSMMWLLIALQFHHTPPRCHRPRMSR